MLYAFFWVIPQYQMPRNYPEESIQLAYSLACKKTGVSMGGWTANMPEEVSSIFLRK
jgi:hypothetical protein